MIARMGHGAEKSTVSECPLSSCSDFMQGEKLLSALVRSITNQ